MEFRVIARNLLVVLCAIPGQAQFEIRGSRLYLEGSPFSVRGVGYSPTPIGEVAGADLRLSGCVYARDLGLAARAGINTVRLYGRIPAVERVLWQVIERNNLYVLADFPLEPYHDPGATLSPDTEAGRALRARILKDFREYAAQLQGQARVLGLVFGNAVGEGYHRKFAGLPRDYYTLAEEAAVVLRQALGGSAPLFTVAVADLGDIGQPALGTRDADLPSLSFWSVNVFRGISFDRFFDEIWRRTGKAALVSEFGIDAWDSGRQVEDAGAQAAGLRNLIRQLGQETGRAGSTVLGGVWFSWSDEWWRGGADATRHGTLGVARAGFPDDTSNAAWFGLFGVTATDLAGVDSLRPRPAFQVLAQEWGGKLPRDWPPPAAPRLRPGGVAQADSLSGAIAPGALISLLGENLAESRRRSLENALPYQLDMTSACVGGRPVPLLSVDAGEVLGQLAWETPPGAARALVFHGGLASNTAAAEVREISPGILERGVTQAGRPCPVSVSNGARPGAYLEVYATGLGRAVGEVATGIAPSLGLLIETGPRIFLGSREIPLLYGGLVPGLIGLYQINTRVPEDFPPVTPVSLRLVAGGAESNPHALTVLAESDRPGVVLGPATLSFQVQAGGPGQTIELPIEGRNGFCELVRFSTMGLPEGVTASLPVGFPGQRVPVTVEAAPQARSHQQAFGLLSAHSLAAENPSVPLQVTVLPSRGDIAFRVVSGGARAGLLARFEMAGRVLYEARGGGPGRGFSFLVLNGATGVLGPWRRFDTWQSEGESEEMADYLAALPAGTVVLGAVADEGTLRLTPRARAAVRGILHSEFIDRLQYQDSWAIIARVGAAQVIAEGWSTSRQVTLERVLTFPMP